MDSSAAHIVVVAPDSFKGSLDAGGAAAAAERGWARARPQDEVRLHPMADGGEGTLDAVAAHAEGSIRHEIAVTGPEGVPAPAEWLELTVDGHPVGLVEIANTSGITMMRTPRNGVEAHSTGFGEAIAAALDAGVEELILALGGSAASDGGAGALQALGARLLDASGADIPPGNRGLGELDRIDLTGLRRPPRHGISVLSDVRSPLLGEAGAVRVFGPQKGVGPDEAAAAEERLARYARLLSERTGVAPETPGAGAAGGAGYAMLAWGATLLSGAEVVAERVGLPAAIESARFVLTGEGRYDASSEHGKVVSVVRSLAESRGARPLLIAGRIDLDPTGFADAASLTEAAGSGDAALADPARWIEECSFRLAERVGGM